MGIARRTDAPALSSSSIPEGGPDSIVIMDLAKVARSRMSFASRRRRRLLRSRFPGRAQRMIELHPFQGDIVRASPRLSIRTSAPNVRTRDRRRQNRIGKPFDPIGIGERQSVDLHRRQDRTGESGSRDASSCRPSRRSDASRQHMGCTPMTRSSSALVRRSPPAEFRPRDSRSSTRRMCWRRTISS
jgi:hypothetical protein